VRRTGLYFATAREAALVPTDSKSDISSSTSVSIAIDAGMPGITSLGGDPMLESSVEVICKEVDAPEVGGVKPVWCVILYKFYLARKSQHRETPCGATTLLHKRVGGMKLSLTNLFTFDFHLKNSF